MIYRVEADKPRKAPKIPSDVAVSYAKDHKSMGIWWYVWRNAFYDVFTTSAEPLFIGRDLQNIFAGQQLNLILYRHRFPVGVLRITLHEGTAHLLAHAVMKDIRSETWDSLIREIALDAAIRAGCDLVFVTGLDDAERKAYREIGFTDSGSILSFTEGGEKNREIDDQVEQFVLVV
jgi:hypothetical protein